MKRGAAALADPDRATPARILRPPACPVCINTSVALPWNLTSAEFKRWLEQRGCTFTSGKGGHLLVRRDDRRSVLPMHGSGREIGKGLEKRIIK